MRTNFLLAAVLLAFSCVAGCGSGSERTSGQEPQAKPTQTAKDVAHEFLRPYFADLETVAFVDVSGAGPETDGQAEVSGIAEGTLKDVWYLIENEYSVTCNQSDDGRWRVVKVAIDGQTVFVDPGDARMYASLQNATKSQRPLRAKPGAVEPK